MIEILSPLSEKNPDVGTLTELHNEFKDKYTGHPIEILSNQSEVNPAEFTLTIIKRKYPLQIIDYALRMKVTLKSESMQKSTKIADSWQGSKNQNRSSFADW